MDSSNNRKEITKGFYISLKVFLWNLLFYAIFILFSVPYLYGAYWRGDELIPYGIILLFTIPFFINSSFVLRAESKNQRKGLLWGYLLCLLIFVLAFTFIYNFNAYNAPRGKNRVIYERALRLNDESICLQVGSNPREVVGAMTRNACLHSVALEKENLEICDKIDDSINDEFDNYTKSRCYEDVERNREWRLEKDKLIK